MSSFVVIKATSKQHRTIPACMHVKILLFHNSIMLVTSGINSKLTLSKGSFFDGAECCMNNLPNYLCMMGLSFDFLQLNLSRLKL